LRKISRGVGGGRRGERERTVTRVREATAGCVGAFLVGAFGSNRLLHTGLRNIGTVRLWRVRVVAGSPDIVDIKVRDAAQGPFNVLITDVVGIRAVCVCQGRVALVESGSALLVVGVEIGLVVSGIDERAVGVVVREIDIGLVGISWLYVV